MTEKTIFEHCLENNYSETYKLLTDSNINDVDNDGDTLLHIACKNNYIDIVKLLLDFPSLNISKCSTKYIEGYTKYHDIYNGTSALYFACCGGYIEIVKLLLEHPNIDSCVRHLCNYCIMSVISATCSLDIINLLLEHESFNTDNSFRTSLLHELCYSKKSDIIMQLIEKFDIDVNDFLYGKNLLMVAYDTQNIELIKELLQHNSTNINIQNKYGASILHHIVLDDLEEDNIKEYKIETIKLFLDHPLIDINLTNKEGRTALYYLCSYSSEIKNKIIKVFLDHPNVNTNIQDNKGKTIFHKLCSGKITKLKLEAIKILLTQSDINTSLKNNNGETALNILNESKNILENVISLIE